MYKHCNYEKKQLFSRCSLIYPFWDIVALLSLRLPIKMVFAPLNWVYFAGKNSVLFGATLYIPVYFEHKIFT